MPKKVKEMPDKGVTGTEKKMKLQEVYDSKAGLTKKEQDKIIWSYISFNPNSIIKKSCYFYL